MKRWDVTIKEYKSRIIEANTEKQAIRQALELIRAGEEVVCAELIEEEDQEEQEYKDFKRCAD